MSMRHSVASQNTLDAAKDFASDVEYYLTQDPRQLPSRYLYDPLGSALFDAICELPWYRIARAELGLLETHGRAIFARAAPLARIAELGPGNGAKLMRLMEAGRQGLGRPEHRLTLHLVDVSAKALDQSIQALAAGDV